MRTICLSMFLCASIATAQIYVWTNELNEVQHSVSKADCEGRYSFSTNDVAPVIPAKRPAALVEAEQSYIDTLALLGTTPQAANVDQMAKQLVAIAQSKTNILERIQIGELGQRLKYLRDRITELGGVSSNAVGQVEE